ncbi:MAG TPA: hypothetical protein HPP87_10540 [Planctomycetes bacterium]|nr:hypothetical protein [Planctomycetota bacterium]
MDLGDFVDEKMEEAGIEKVDEEQAKQEEPETDVDVERETEAEAETEQEASDSGQSRLFTESDDENDTRVPLRVVADLRAKNRQLKQENQQLKAQGDHVPSTVKDEYAPSEDDEDFLTVRQAKQLAQQEAQRLLEQQQKAALKQQENQKLKSFLIESETKARKEIKDYDRVLEAATKEGVIGRKEWEDALTSNNPAKKMYIIAKQSLTALGHDLSPPAKETTTKGKDPEVEYEEDPNKFFDEVFKR